jgi:hypothetical protein
MQYYLTITLSKLIFNMAKGRMEANAVVAELKMAGYNVEHIKKSRRANSIKRKQYINIVKVTIGADVYYVCPLPRIEEYGLEFIHAEYKQFNYFRGRIDLYYENGVKCKIGLNKKEIEFNGVKYCNERYGGVYPRMGHLCGNMYTSYENAWIMYMVYRDLADSIIDPRYLVESELAILDLDFNAKQPIQINIQNEGLKIVVWKEIRKKDTFTLFDDKHIADGLYTESGRDDIFKYISPNGELTALLVDTQSGGMTLASSTQSIGLTDLKSCLIRRENGLYAGFDIKFIHKEITITEADPEPGEFISARGDGDYDSDSDCYNEWVSTYRDEFDTYPSDYRDNNGMLWVDDTPVYKYGYTFFTTSRSVELEIRTPNSGKYTKPANPLIR